MSKKLITNFSVLKFNSSSSASLVFTPFLRPISFNNPFIFIVFRALNDMKLIWRCHLSRWKGKRCGGGRFYVTRGIQKPLYFLHLNLNKRMFCIETIKSSHQYTFVNAIGVGLVVESCPHRVAQKLKIFLTADRLGHNRMFGIPRWPFKKNSNSFTA